jgi:hypothetical protein
VTTIGTIKKMAASTAIAASLGLGGLGLASGIASAAPADHAGSAAGVSTKSEHQAHPAPKTAASGDGSEVHAHLIPGFTPKPTTTTTTSGGGLGEEDPNFNGGPPDNPHCRYSCDEIIHE